MSGAPSNANDKSRRYIAALDSALCNGQWTDVPELSRKVDKHAPERGTLTLTARAEAALAAKDESDGGQGLSDYTTKLVAAIEADQFHTDDGYCARVCLADIYRRQGNVADALKVLPDDASQHQDGDATLAPLAWLEVCQAKSTYIRAHALDQSGGQEKEVKAIHRSATQRASVGSRTPALRKWNEKLLFRAAMADFKNVQDPSVDTLNESLASFRAWTAFGQRTASPDTTRAFSGIPRRQVWKAHYELLTTVLRRGLTYNPSDKDDLKLLVDASSVASEDQLASAKTKQFAELKQVERAYEALIIDETQFPKSSESNMEVEEWVEMIMGNWNILCGPNWTDAALGHGGREAHTRAVLDTLYRAATKTFHSTAILRHLFTIHSWLGEFDLAMHAFHSYDEIVTRGKARAEKTGKHEIGFDSDDTAVTTAANAIRILCRYGDRDEAERAIEVAKILERWMGQHRPSLDDTALEKELQTTVSNLQPSIAAAAHRAMGIAEATWARHTHDTNARSALQIKAIDHLQQAQRSYSGDVATAYTLARLLAESRDVQAAISVIRQCIDNDESEDDEQPDDRERQLIPLWHLLALCLSAKHEHSSALQACAAAFDQFDDSTVLLGQSNQGYGLVDQMGSLEKQTIVEIKLTQLALTEVTEGPEAAVDSTDDILALYARLFGRHDNAEIPSTPQSQSSLSTSSPKEASAVRSIAGSIRPKSNRSSVIDSARRGSLFGGPRSEKNADADAVSNRSQHHLHLPFRSKSHRKSQPPPPTDAPPLPGKAPFLDSTGVDAAVGYSVSSQLPSGNAEQPLREMKHDLRHDQLVGPAGHHQQPPRQDVRLPAPHPSQNATPESRVGSLQDEQQRIGLLVKVWLCVAGLYTRAGSHEDATGAIEEATKLAQKYEVSKSGEHSSTNNFYFKGWGGGRSVEGLWAEVFCAQADLALAQGLPFDAMEHYDLALAHDPDHAQSIIGVSDLLMDTYEQKMPAEKPADAEETVPAAPASFLHTAKTKSQTPGDSKTEVITRIPTVESKGHTGPSPATLNRLAARDRAYLLLSTLTNLGTGWDNSAAWYSLARSYELSKQVEKAKQALWWVVSLEDHKPVRSWLESSPGGYTV